jgi:sugar lactone lactonase YvrE
MRLVKNLVLLLIMVVNMAVMMCPQVKALPFHLGEPRNSGLDIFAKMKEAPGNVAALPDGSVVVSLHQFFDPQNKVVRVSADGLLKPFPDATWNKSDNTNLLTLDSVLGIRTDEDDIVWMLDNGMRNKTTPKLVAWDARSSQLYKLICIPEPISLRASFLNDLAVDRKHEAVFIADTASGDSAAIIVVDLNTGASRRVLQGHHSVCPEAINLVVDGKAVEIKQADGSLVKPHLGINPIAVDAAGNWLYYGPMHGHSMYRIKTTDLLNKELTPVQLASKVERYSDKPICDGITMDGDDNIYVTDLANNAVGIIGPDRAYRLVVQDPLLSWPDAFAITPDDFLIIVANQLQRSPQLNGGVNQTVPPFYLLRIKLPIKKQQIKENPAVNDVSNKETPLK